MFEMNIIQALVKDIEEKEHCNYLFHFNRVGRATDGRLELGLLGNGFFQPLFYSHFNVIEVPDHEGFAPDNNEPYRIALDKLLEISQLGYDIRYDQSYFWSSLKRKIFLRKNTSLEELLVNMDLRGG